MPIKSIIIDDEFRARRALRSLCERFIPDLEIVADAASVAEGVEAIREHAPEIVFLDVRMPSGDGFTLLEQHVLPDLHIVFTTAHEEYAIRALRLQAHDYLLKPIAVADIEAAVERYRERKTARPTAETPAHRGTFPEESGLLSLPTEEGILLARHAEVLQCEGVGSYTIFHLENGRQVIVTRNLKQFEEQFQDKGFYRVHHRHLVNITHVAEVNSRNNFLRLKNGDVVNISQRKKAGFLKRLRELR
ncbi:MAG: LytTR family DNA-binding domain-containing protein [Bacteroidota bacterium]